MFYRKKQTPQYFAQLFCPIARKNLIIHKLDTIPSLIAKKNRTMKVKYNALAALVLTAMTIFVACEKNVISLQDSVPVGAKVKFVQACSNCPSLLITANGALINPTPLAYTTTSSSFPAGGYAILPSGDVNLDFVRSDSSKSLFTSKISVSADKWYTVYIGDTVPTPSISLIEDDIKPFQDTLLRVRFVNMLSGRTKDTLELWHQNTKKVVGENVTYGKASQFTFTPGISDTFFYRKVGASVIYPLSGSVVFSNSKAQTFTIFARGVNNKITGNQTPKLDWWRNR